MSQNLTKEGIEVKPGQVWRDLDKRSNGRTKRVLSVADGKAQFEGPPKTKVAIDRMHRNSTGYELVSDV
ncbi:conserved hypothetical protein [Paraburkholderia tropica]|uniref:hypothetical protein n=1 Tax=Paraburkholderia tropica TaxID=92647 RepID=UPI001CB1D85B|nr:hypothetical protein [Paraburkholderia tropica]CAG9207724.1 conserved hypothetical protein [Paraburkholderia tropica]